MLLANGAPERIRTSDPQIRNLVLYPAELPGPRCDSSKPPWLLYFFLDVSECNSTGFSIVAPRSASYISGHFSEESDHEWGRSKSN